jgi:hypothetical protein
MLGAAVGAVLAMSTCALSGCAPSTWEPQRTPSATTSSWRPATLPITCGSGFGAASADSGTTADRPIWSLGWSGIDEGTAPYEITDPGGRTWQSVKAPISVAAGASGTVRVTSPTTARVVVSTAEAWQNAAEVSPLTYVTSEALLPACDAVDAYPSLVLVPEPACVTLTVVPSGRQPYDVAVPVGVNCP